MSGVQEQGANGEGEESEEGKEDEESRREYETAEEDKEMGGRESRAAARRHGVACGCSQACTPILNVIPQSGKQLDKEKGLRLLQDTRAIGWDRFCEGHLRHLAGG